MTSYWLNYERIKKERRHNKYVGSFNLNLTNMSSREIFSGPSNMKLKSMEKRK